MKRGSMLAWFGATAAGNTEYMLLRSTISFSVSSLESTLYPTSKAETEFKKALSSFPSDIKKSLGTSAPLIVSAPAVAVKQTNGQYVTSVVYRVEVPKGTGEADLTNTAIGSFIKNFIKSKSNDISDRLTSFSVTTKREVSATPKVQAIVKPNLPLSYTQQWATIYLMIAGDRPLSSQEVLGLLSPWLTGKLVTPQMPEVKSVRVTVVVDPDVGPIIDSAPFTDGGKLYQVNAVSDNIVTGIKWNLRHPENGAITDELAGELRSGFRSTGKQSFERLGFKVLLSSIYPYTKGPGTSIIDYRIPPTPALPELPKEPVAIVPKKIVQPVQPTPQPIVVATTTPKTSLIHWLIGATALIGVAIATRKINGGEKAKKAANIEGLFSIEARPLIQQVKDALDRMDMYLGINRNFYRQALKDAERSYKLARSHGAVDKDLERQLRIARRIYESSEF